MKMLSFVLIALVGTMILGLPVQSYADPQLDTLLSIATQARDNLGVTISQTNNVPNQITQLYNQGSTETDELAKAVAQQDADSAKQHFLAAMKFFKETNDQINSLNTTAANNQQQAEIIQLRGEIVRLDSMENLLKTIATNNNIDVNFTKFDELVQTAQQDLNSGNVDDATTVIKNANDFLVQIHNSLTTIAQERIAERAKDFTEKQIERFSKMNEFNATNSTAPTTPPTQPPSIPPTVSSNTTGINATNNTSIQPPTTPTIQLPTQSPPQSIQQPIQPQTPPPTTPPTQPPSIPPTVSSNTTGINATSSFTTLSSTTSVQNNSNIVAAQNPEEMLTELKRLVSEGKINEALKIIKLIEAYQKEKLTVEKVEQPSSASTNSVENLTNNTSIQPPTPPTTPPTQPPSIPPTVSSNTTGINATSSSTTQSNTLPSTIPNDHEKYNPEKDKQNKEQTQQNDQPNSNSKHD